MTWVDVCDLEELIFDRGVCALVGDRQVAIFRTSPDGELFAISNYDPFSRAFVMSRGIVGSRAGIPKVASPIYKQTFDLRTGQCLEDPDVSITSYPIRVIGGRVQVELR